LSGTFGVLVSFAVTQPGLLQEKGAFVTLRKHGDLRGCIGHLIGDRPLYLVVQKVAVSAAVADQRFPLSSARAHLGRPRSGGLLSGCCPRTNRFLGDTIHEKEEKDDWEQLDAPSQPGALSAA
jgi:hypothetical protein